MKEGYYIYYDIPYLEKTNIKNVTLKSINKKEGYYIDEKFAKRVQSKLSKKENILNAKTCSHVIAEFLSVYAKKPRINNNPKT